MADTASDQVVIDKILRSGARVWRDGALLYKTGVPLPCPRCKFSHESVDWENYDPPHVIYDAKGAPAVTLLWGKCPENDEPIFASSFDMVGRNDGPDNMLSQEEAAVIIRAVYAAGGMGYLEKMVYGSYGLDNCARCGESHQQLEWRAFKHEGVWHDRNGRPQVAIGYAYCPTNGQPITLVSALDD
jgi:hypothetical protein